MGGWDLAITSQVQTSEVRAERAVAAIDGLNSIPWEEGIWMHRSSSTSVIKPRVVRLPSEILTGVVVELDPADVTTSGNEVTLFNNTNGIGGPCGVASETRASFIEADPDFAYQPSIQFSGSSSATGSWYTLPELSELTAGEAFIVLKCDYSYPDTEPPSLEHMGLWQTGGDELVTLYNSASGSIVESFGSTAVHDMGVTDIAANQPHIYNVRASVTDYVGYQSMAPDGVIYTSTTNAVGFPVAPTFGRSSETHYFNGRLAYAVITDQVQTPEARFEMLSYLANRFGIALPVLASPTPKTILAGLHVELVPSDATFGPEGIVEFKNSNGIGGVLWRVTPNAAQYTKCHAGFAGEPVAEFFTETAYVLPDLSALTEGEAFLVLSTNYKYPSPLPPNSNTCGVWRVGATTGASYYCAVSTGQIQETFGLRSGSFNYGVGSRVTSTDAHIYNVRIKPGLFHAWNSIAGRLYTHNSPSIAFHTGPVFGWTMNTHYFSGRVGYIAVTNQVQTPAARTAMLVHLAQRFGIVLPSELPLE